MTSEPLRIVAHGKPGPQGSVRSLGTGRPSIHGNANRLLPWRDTIIAATIHAMRKIGWVRGDGAFSVYAVFYFDRPKAHFTARGTLKPTASKWPTTRVNGDLDHLARAVGDALTAAGAIRDDSQIVSWTVTKQFCETDPDSGLTHPGAVLRLVRLTETTMQPEATTSKRGTLHT